MGSVELSRLALAQLIDLWARETCTCGGTAACVGCQYADRATFQLSLMAEGDRG